MQNMKNICMAYEMSDAEYFTMRFIHDFCDVCIVLITDPFFPV